jgi:molybdate transport system substrate-binding protein
MTMVLRGWVRSSLVATVFMVIAAGTGVAAETVEIYAAGSLKAAVEALAREIAPVADVEIKPTFGGSGSLRQRIEGGEHPDLFLSADMAAPRSLADSGRTIVPVIAFARNRMCLVARRSIGLTEGNFVDRMLAKDVRLKTSTPVADPAGDYALAIFDRIDAARPGAGHTLREKAQALADSLKPTPPVAGHTAGASLFLNNEIDMMVTYCSGKQAIENEVPDLTALAFPSELEPQPVYGLAVLSAKPSALRIALYLLSQKGQAIIERAGLLPILGQTR